MSNDDDDHALAQQAQRGCEAAFTRLFHRHYGAVHAFAFRLCADAAGAEEIAQEAFIKAARHLPGFRREASFKNCLYRIVLHATRDWQRSAIRRRNMAEAFTRHATAEEGVREADFGPLYEALGQLPEAHRQTVLLVYGEGLDHRAAAQILGCAETTVSWRVFRAKRQLRKALTHKPR